MDMGRLIIFSAKKEKAMVSYDFDSGHMLIILSQFSLVCFNSIPIPSSNKSGFNQKSLIPPPTS
jgi:hypothetical protein